MATIAIGDIHGNLAALNDLLSQVAPQVSDEDVVVFLGDYIDRGPDSRGCVETILGFIEQVPASVVCLLGNHEDWMLRSARDHSKHSWLLSMDALTTIESYSQAAARELRAAIADAGLRLYLGGVHLPYDVFFDAMAPSHRKFFDHLALCHETPDCFCSHAGLNPLVPTLAEQTRDDLVWGHGRFPADYRGEQFVVYGHEACHDLDADGWPKIRIEGRTFGIDTISHGVLTAIRFPERQIIRSARHVC